MTKMAGPARATRTAIAEVSIVRLDGEFDLATAHLITACLAEANQYGGQIVVDLRGTTFLDSTALGAILGARRAAENAWLRLVAPRPAVARILQITGLDLALGVYPTLANAMDTQTVPTPASAG